jgi:hypothetical protein
VADRVSLGRAILGKVVLNRGLTQVLLHHRRRYLSGILGVDSGLTGVNVSFASEQWTMSMRELT